jgi:hypothetical protein
MVHQFLDDFLIRWSAGVAPLCGQYTVNDLPTFECSAFCVRQLIYCQYLTDKSAGSGPLILMTLRCLTLPRLEHRN